MDLQQTITNIGIPLMFVGMVVVFGSLLALMFVMKGLKRILNTIHRLHVEREEQRSGSTAASDLPENPDDVHGILIAAIAITLILEAEQAHDEESLVLTLRAMPKPYANWWLPTSGGGPLPRKSPYSFRPTRNYIESTL